VIVFNQGAKHSGQYVLSRNISLLSLASKYFIYKGLFLQTFKFVLRIVSETFVSLQVNLFYILGLSNINLVYFYFCQYSLFYFLLLFIRFINLYIVGKLVLVLGGTINQLIILNYFVNKIKV
jgi:hypothetical protein